MTKLLNIAAVLLMVFASPAFAESDDDVVVCAAVHPCNADGTVMAPYNKGECAARYALECAADVANKIGEDLVSCENENAALKLQLETSLKKLSRLQKAARRAARPAR